jgi:cell filamentation protein
MSQYSLDPIAANCYPDTTVLINKFGIRNEERLLQAETAITQEAAARWEISPQQHSFGFEHYKAIHRHLFQDLYDWAGQVRDVNISKKGTQFCPHEEIENLAGRMFARLQKVNCLKGLRKGKFISSFVELYVATNYLHPFREGNGRVQRLFLAQLVRSADYGLDFAGIDVDELMIATIQSAHGVKDGLTRIFEKAIYEPSSLLDKIQKNRELVERGKKSPPDQKRKPKEPER